MIDPPCVLETEAQPIAILPLTVPRREMQKVMQPGLHELLAVLASQRIAPTGPCFTHHLRITPEVFDFEIGAPVAISVAAAGRVKPSLRPVLRVARTIYHGPYEGLPAAWGEFDTWIATQGHVSAVDLWETYLAHPDSSSDPAQWRTQLERPVERMKDEG